MGGKGGWWEKVREEEEVQAKSMTVELWTSAIKRGGDRAVLQFTHEDRKSVV